MSLRILRLRRCVATIVPKYSRSLPPLPSCPRRCVTTKTASSADQIISSSDETTKPLDETIDPLSPDTPIDLDRLSQDIERAGRPAQEAGEAQTRQPGQGNPDRKGLTKGRKKAKKPDEFDKKAGKEIMGKVTSAGKMAKTVRVDVPVKEWDRHLRKYFRATKHYLVHDENDSLRMGDMVAFRRAPFRVSPGELVKHVVTEILVPFGPEIRDRPPIPSFQKLKALDEAVALRKRERRMLRRNAAAGDEMAKKRVKELGIAVKETTRGGGRGKKTMRSLERELVKR